MATNVVRECLVCYDSINLKILPCAHLMCRQCVLSWLVNKGPKCGCPVCRAPLDILSGQGDLAQQVDSLPTDLVTAVKVDSQQMLTAPHVCPCSRKASFFCMLCSIKLCGACNEDHVKKCYNPSQAIEELNDLTAEELVAHRGLICGRHGDKPAELYCTLHEELVCMGCQPHVTCEGKMAVYHILEIAPIKREELRGQLELLMVKEAECTDKINLMSNIIAYYMKRNAELYEAGLQVGTVYQYYLANCIGSWLSQLQFFKVCLEKLQTTVTANRKMAEQVVAEAPDVALMGMAKNLIQRLKSKTLWLCDRHPRLQEVKMALKSEKTFQHIHEELVESLKQEKKRKQ